MPTPISTGSSSAAAPAGISTGAIATAGDLGSGPLPAELDASLGGMVAQSGRVASAQIRVAPIGNDAVQANINAIKVDPSHLDQTKASIQQQISDPATPPDLKEGLQHFLSVIDGNQPNFSNQEMGTISVLQRHRDIFPVKMSEIQQRIDDPNVLPDVRDALIQVKNDRTLNIALDSQNQGGGVVHVDGCLSDRDLDRLGELPAMKTFNEAQAKNFVDFYIPSDADSSVKFPRKMTENDAEREFYLYSDNLPGHLNKKVLKDIVDGQACCNKCPPQVIAAAQYFRDHPASWDKLTSDSNGTPNAQGGTKRSHMLDNIAKTVYLNTDEKTTLDTLDKNRGVFFPATRDSLQKLIDNPDSKLEVKKAAQKLLDDPLLFGMLDNGKAGHSSNLIKSADDGKIGTGDLDAFMANLTTKNKKQSPLPPTHKASTPAEKSAVAAMQAGELDHPKIKQEKGGGFIHFLRSVITPFLKVAEMVEHAISIAMSALTKIPFIGEIAGAISMAAEAMAGGLHIVTAAINGADIKKAAIAAGAGIAGALVGLVVTGAGAAIAKGITAGVEHVAMAASTKAATALGERGAAKAATSAGTEGATTTAERGAAKAATSTSEEGATKSGANVAKSEGSDQAKREAKQKAKDERKDELRDETTDTATNSTVDNHNNNGQVPVATIQRLNYDSIIAEAKADAARLQAAAAQRAQEAAEQSKRALATKHDAAKVQAAAGNASRPSLPNPDSVAAAAA